jgi:hypothetical protein
VVASLTASKRKIWNWSRLLAVMSATTQASSSSAVHVRASCLVYLFMGPFALVPRSSCSCRTYCRNSSRKGCIWQVSHDGLRAPIVQFHSDDQDLTKSLLHVGLCSGTP